MREQHTKPSLVSAAVVGVGLLVAGGARASNPLEYPDNGAAQFARGGAWLAVGNEPIAAHYNPAALATQASAFSVEQQLNFNHVCYDRHGPNGAVEEASPGIQYRPACNARSSFPSTIPSISISWRASRKLGIGFAIVPPATYGVSDGMFPPLKIGFNKGIQDCLAAGGTPEQCGGSTPYQPVPAPYRYQMVQQLSTIVFPTLGVGYEVAPKFRVGAAFISGIAVINTSVFGVQTDPAPAMGTTTPEAAANDSYTVLKTKDLFVPGAILAVHWSPAPVLDVAAWGRWISDVVSSEGDLTVDTLPFNGSFNALQPICRQAQPADCTSSAIRTHYGPDSGALKKFRFPYPPEVRAGVRFHMPRTAATPTVAAAPSLGSTGFTSRDPLHDDVFDIELDGSYSLNTKANTIEVRFADNGNGAGVKAVPPAGQLPPNADKWNGFKDSVGIRLGGQYNVIRDKLGLRAGTWFETKSQEDEWLTVYPVGATRGGFGGGIVFRQNFIDISIGYQYHWSSGLDNGGNGAMKAAAGTPEANLNNEPPGVSAADRQQFRTYHTVNDGRLTQSAHAFSLGGTVRF